MRLMTPSTGDGDAGGMPLGGALRDRSGEPPRPIGSAASAASDEPSPLRVVPDAGSGYRSDDGRSRARIAGVSASVGIHAALFALLLVRVQPVLPPIPPGSMVVTYIVEPGDPPAGDPKGDDAPPKPASSQAEEAPAEKVEPIAASPTPSDAPAAEAEAESKEKEAGTAPVAPVQISDRAGSGTLAMGARTHGDAQGLDPALIASVSLALASRIRACWTPPEGTAPNDLASSVIVRYALDGTVSGEPGVVHLVDDVEVPVAAPNPWEQQAVDAAKRCSPIQLPKSLYAYWREIELQVYSVR